MPTSRWLGDLGLRTQLAHRRYRRATCQMLLEQSEKQMKNGRMGAWLGFRSGRILFFVTCHRSMLPT